MTIKINGTNTAANPSITGSDTDTGIVYGSDQIDFSTGGSSKVTLNGSNLGVGETSPLGKFHVKSADSGASVASYADELVVEGSTDSGLTILSGNNKDGSLAFGDDGNNVAGRVVYNHPNDALQFYVNATEKMRLYSHGGLSVGATHNNGFAGSILADTGFYIGEYNGDKLMSDGSQGGGSSTIYIGNAAIQVSSDQRIKTDIVNTTLDATTKLKQVRVVDFKWNDPTDKAEVNRNSRGTWTGCLAQEMVNIFPYTVNAPRKEDNSVDTESERTWGLEYQHLVPALIKGFQEQQAKIEALEAKVAALEAA